MKTKINKKYTHFAVHTATGKIVDGWEYPKSYEREDIMVFYKEDMKDNDRSLKDFKLVDALTLFKKGVNPYDNVNWINDHELNIPVVEFVAEVKESNITPVVNHTITFSSPINREYSCTPNMDVLSEDTVSTIEIHTDSDGSGWFEWDIEELEITESGCLEFEGNRLVGYDGLFELPTQLMDYLDSVGFITEDCR